MQALNFKVTCEIDEAVFIYVKSTCMIYGKDLIAKPGNGGNGGKGGYGGNGGHVQFFGPMSHPNSYTNNGEFFKRKTLFAKAFKKSMEIM